MQKLELTIFDLRRVFIGIALVTIVFPSHAQQLTYRGEWVDSLIIASNISAYEFDDKGTTRGRYEEMVVLFSEELNGYVLSKYQRTEYIFTFKPESESSKIKVKARDEKLDQELVSEVLKAFEVDSVQPNFSSIGLSEDEFYGLTKKKRIAKVAKRIFEDWRYLSKGEKDEFIKGIQSTDTLNFFLNSLTPFFQEIITTDFDDHLEVCIYTKKAVYNFERNYPNDFTQPWLNQSSQTRFNTPHAFNLQVNKVLVDILPPKFSRIESLQFEGLMREYIHWYGRQRDFY
jgi:hypothetical protein